MIFGLPFELASCAEPLSGWLSGVRLIRGAEGSRSSAAAAPATVIGEPRRLQDGDRRPVFVPALCWLRHCVGGCASVDAPLLREPQIYAKISDLKATSDLMGKL